MANAYSGIINVPGNVLGKGRSRRISLSPNRILQWIIGVKGVGRCNRDLIEG